MCLTISGIACSWRQSPRGYLYRVIIIIFFVSRPINQIYEDVIGVTRSP